MSKYKVTVLYDEPFYIYLSDYCDVLEIVSKAAEKYNSGYYLYKKDDNGVEEFDCNVMCYRVEEV